MVERLKRAAGGKVAQVGIVTLLATAGGEGIEFLKSQAAQQRAERRQERIDDKLEDYGKAIVRLDLEVGYLRTSAGDSVTRGRGLHERVNALQGAVFDVVVGRMTSARGRLAGAPKSERSKPQEFEPPTIDEAMLQRRADELFGVDENDVDDEDEAAAEESPP